MKQQITKTVSLGHMRKKKPRLEVLKRLNVLFFFTVVGTDCKVSADITEWNCTEKLYEYLGESCAKSSGRSTEYQTDKRIAADSVHVTLHLGPECWQVCSSWQHKHVGLPNGDDSSLAAAAEQYPDHQA
uniref:Uncharacterized protein n=1 Tax=Micrurus lemniscatus lemniscatus TaxID=129467 RepID=A0A2D4IIT0_MICLE